ncbi:MAG: hypothetical protein DVB25_00885 [Verrucomicrobia bacterium]|nr:MAG: hypothetical protein DVB25_00885 [Verrucomicrobiota bacterium]
MKLVLSPTGGLCIEAEVSSDWQLLLGILHDAQGSGFDLASQVGGHMNHADASQDWEEFVLTDLRDGFLADLKTVLTAVEAARLVAADGPGQVWIGREDARHWYSALNHARLALEAIHHFGSGLAIDPDELVPSRLAAGMRAHFYCAVQSVLLDLGLG